MTRAKTAKTVIAGLLTWALFGCEGSADPAGEGVPCYRAQECSRGLICLQGVCTSDVSSSVPEGAGTPLDLGLDDTLGVDASALGGASAELMSGDIEDAG